MITAIVYEIFFLAEAVVTQYYNIDLMLQVFFSDLSVWLIVYVFYNLIHRVVNRLTDAGKPYGAISIVHWVILAILGAISIAAWGIYVAFRVYYVQGSRGNLIDLVDSMNKVDSARVILFWVVSMEIFAWFLFAAVKAGSHRFPSRVSFTMTYPMLSISRQQPPKANERSLHSHSLPSMPLSLEVSVGSPFVLRMS